MDLLRIAHPRGAQDWLHDTTLLSKKRFNKKERPSSRNKLRRMAPSTGLSRSGSDFKAVVPLHTGAIPAETPSDKDFTSLSIETIRDDIPVFVASHNSWRRQSPFFLRDGATTRLGTTPGCGRCHVLYCGKDRFRNAQSRLGGLRRPRPRPRSCRRALRPKGRSLPRIRPYRWTRCAYPPLTFAADPIFSGNLPPMTRAGGHLCSSSGMPCNCASSFTI